MLHDYVDICRELVLSTIDSNRYAVFLFGSRARGNHFPHSDIDIGLWGNEEMDARTMLDLEEALENSMIPYKVDLVDFKRTDESFRKVALENIVIWNSPPAFHWPLTTTTVH
ncbi:nucleotidyltransferase domain-containing protein [Larkinella punicea]|uniref:Nucleotidyltransferase domain-containing protein n=1 Tax=Larkinella punicea TaxID=2315727 RepID=A0A368JIC4_9BACT|nr:nucleotidyltransferase domain-containing protein [Larkinella punicea]